MPAGPASSPRRAGLPLPMRAGSRRRWRAPLTAVRLSLVAGLGAGLAAGLALGGPTARAEESSAPPSPSSPSASVRTPGRDTAAIPPEATRPDATPVADMVAPVLGLVLRTSEADGAATTDTDGNKTRTTLSGDVTFETDSATLTPRAKEVLDSIAKGWGSTPPKEVTVVGHTDSVADDAYNQTLSEQRAQAVVDYLTTKASSVTMTASGKGETEPAQPETREDGSVDEQAQAANRRVVITWEQ